MTGAKLISGLTLAGILAAAAAGFWFIMPGEAETVERLASIGQTERALELLESLPENQRSRRAEHFAVLELRLRGKLAREDGGDAALTAHIEHALEEGAAFEWPPEISDELSASMMSLDVNRAHEILRRAGADLPSDLRDEIIRQTSLRALGEGDPGQSARLLEMSFRARPRDQALTFELIDLWRQAGRPEQALLVLEQHESARGEPVCVRSEEAGLIKVALLRETSREGEAFDCLMALIDSQHDAVPPDSLFILMRQTAAGSDRLSEFAPYWERRLRREDGAHDEWRELAELWLSTGDSARALVILQEIVRRWPENSEHRLRLSEVAEWESQPGVAFDNYLMLARAGQAGALDRLLQLNPGLYRDHELTEALDAIVSMHGRHEMRGELAYHLTRLGHYHEAAALYHDQWRADSSSREAGIHAIRLYKFLFHYEEAFGIIDEILELYPDDYETLTERAELLYVLGDFDGALEAYIHLTSIEPDQAYVNAAIALAQHTGLFRELLHLVPLRMELQESPDPQDYLLLAYAASIENEGRLQFETLRDGVEVFPEHAGLRIQLAYLMSNEGRFMEARRVVEGFPRFETHPELLLIYLWMIEATADFEEGQRFLEAQHDNHLLETAMFLPRVARIHEGNGNLWKAEALYVRLQHLEPDQISHLIGRVRVMLAQGRAREARRTLESALKHPAGEALLMASRVTAGIGNYRAAEDYLIRFLETEPDPTAYDWGLLGDIRLARGDRRGAYRAYSRAVAVMEAEIQ